jgi:hypothetical protein
MLYPSKKLRFKGKLREGVDENDEVVVNDEEVKRWRTKTTADKNLQQQISEDIKEEKERKKKKKRGREEARFEDDFPHQSVVSFFLLSGPALFLQSPLMNLKKKRAATLTTPCSTRVHGCSVSCFLFVF